ncbi:predicted protein [Botrytis cinerea T4]|uniref:Uncharacterized protein n=1 Tax=Botryotinia fuckeliana (strain T4) TaxID=999810 RepID=G2Y8W3_BOTF4|nr:predicted protein [Botrytis cinerea T4]
MGVSNAELSRLEDSRRLEPDSLSNQIPHSSLGIVRQYEIYDSRMSTVWAAWHPKQIMGLYACKTSQVLPAPITGLEVREPNRGIGQRSSPRLKISSRMIVIVSVLLAIERVFRWYRKDTSKCIFHFERSLKVGEPGIYEGQHASDFTRH